jgi:Recombinase zinc beta ribbon domain
LQEAIKADARPRGYYQRPGDIHMMLRLVYCGECDMPYYHQHNGGNNYYRCNGWRKGGHKIPSIRAETLEDMAEDNLLRLYGDRQIERRVSTGKDYGREITMTENEIDELENEYMTHRLSGERFARMSTRLEARLADLTRLAETATGPQWEPTGETVRERWERSSREDRHVMLTRLGLRWYVTRQFRISDHAWRWDLESSWLPEDEAHERLTRVDY